MHNDFPVVAGETSFALGRALVQKEKQKPAAGNIDFVDS